MEKIIDNKTRAIIVAIENYRYEKISKVKYALNDATAFKDLLISDFNVNPESIKMYLDKYASRTALDEELRYEIRNLQSDEKFIFYYVGHGFYGDGTNKLTAWDTSDTNFAETTLALKDILIDPLNESECDKSLIFLDTCSKYISDSILSREAISNIDNKELEYLIEQSSFSATFISCSPGEKSYSDENLQHGIWTFHLLEALRGESKCPLFDNKYITDTILRDYLRRSVPQFITEKTDIKDSQTPYANLSAPNTFIIHEIIKKEEVQQNNEFPSLEISSSNIKLLNRELISVQEASGFKSGHWPPDRVSDSGQSFIQSAFSQETSDEIQQVYQKAKDILQLRRRDIKKEIDFEGGVIENAFFDYALSVFQNNKYPAYCQFDRELTIHDFNLITPEFDKIFSVKMKSIFLDCNILEKDYEAIVEQFENLADSENGRLIDDDRKLIITYTAIDGVVLKLKFIDKNVLFTTDRNYKIKDFLERIESLINRISKDGFTFSKK